MNDVFDEDLMKELGLDPDEIEAVRSKVPEPKRARQVNPSEGAKATVDATDHASVSTPSRPEPSQADPLPKPVLSPPSKKKTLQTEMPAESRPAAGEQMAGGISVHLAAVLGKKTITLRDVAGLKSGEVLDFNKQPQDLIDLVANGKLVAKAELVMVDGRVGARIIKLIK